MNSTTDQKADSRYHCSICNTIFENPTFEGDCPNCDSPFIHPADPDCIEMARHEWKSDASGSY